jgi:hypothetical protein
MGVSGKFKEDLYQMTVGSNPEDRVSIDTLITRVLC